MKILQVKKSPIYDIFMGEGWHNWSRIILQKEGLKIIGGMQLIPSIKAEVMKSITQSKSN
jgi:hypothetical protein